MLSNGSDDPTLTQHPNLLHLHIHLLIPRLRRLTLPVMDVEPQQAVLYLREARLIEDAHSHQWPHLQLSLEVAEAELPRPPSVRAIDGLIAEEKGEEMLAFSCPAEEHRDR